MSLPAYLPMKCFPILRAVLPTLGKDLDAIVPFAKVDMDLAVFAINFLLDAHSAMAHIQAVLNAASFEPCLPAHFDSQLGLDDVQDLTTGGSTGGVRQEPSLHGLSTLDCYCKIVLNLQNRGEYGIT